MEKSDKKLLNEILQISFPAIIDDVLLSVVGLVDTLMVSTLGSAAITAIGIVNQPKLFIFSTFFAMQICISMLIARKVGETNKQEGNEVFLVGLIYTIVLSLVLSLFFYIIARPFMVFCGANSDTIENSIVYFRIIMIGLIFNTFYYYVNAVERGCGNTKLTLTTNAIAYVVNIILNYLLIEGKCGFPRLEVRGAAIATVTGNVAASIFAFVKLCRKDSCVNTLYIIKNKIKVSKESFVLVIRNWWSIFVDLFLTRIGFMLQSAISARMGTIDYAVHHIGMLLLSFAYSFGNGISAGAVSLVGSSIGAKDIPLAKRYANLSKKLGLCISVCISLILLVFGGSLFKLFFEDEYSLQLGRIVAIFLAIIIPIAIYKIVIIGIVRSGGDNKYVMDVSIIANTIIQPITSFLLIVVFKIGIYGAWIGIFISQITAMMLMLFRYKSEKWIKVSL